MSGAATVSGPRPVRALLDSGELVAAVRRHFDLQ